MLQGYFDDSGSEPNSQIFVLAGYIHPASGWAEFSDEWSAALKQRPKIKTFKMSHAFSGRGEFSGIDLEFRKGKVRDLLSVIQKHNPDGTAASDLEGVFGFL